MGGNVFLGPEENPAGRLKGGIWICCPVKSGSTGSVAGTGSGWGSSLSVSYTGVTRPFGDAGCARHPDTWLSPCEPGDAIHCFGQCTCSLRLLISTAKHGDHGHSAPTPWTQAYTDRRIPKVDQDVSLECYFFSPQRLQESKSTSFRMGQVISMFRTPRRSQFAGLQVKGKYRRAIRKLSLFPSPHQSTQADVQLPSSKYMPKGSSKCVTCACKTSCWQNGTMYMLARL